MAKIKNWKKVKNQKLDWKKEDGSQQIWVYPHKTWEVSKKTGNVKNYRTTHYTVRTYSSQGKSLAKALKGRHFKTQKTAKKFAISYMKGRN